MSLPAYKSVAYVEDRCCCTSSPPLGSHSAVGVPRSCILGPITQSQQRKVLERFPVKFPTRLQGCPLASTFPYVSFHAIHAHRTKKEKQAFQFSFFHVQPLFKSLLPQDKVLHT